MIMRDSAKKYVILISLLTVLTLLVLSLIIGSQRGLWSSLETQSSQIAKEFLEHNDFVVPHLNGVEDNEKPAFFFWLIAICSFFLGSVSELSSRLPSFLSLIFIMVLFFRLEKDKNKIFTSIIASAILITSPKVFWMSQVSRMDMVFAVLCFSQVVFFINYQQEEKQKTKKLFYYLFFVSSGFAVLCKGPAGFILPSLPILSYFLINKKYQDLKHFFLGKGLIVLCLIILPWYTAIIIKTDGRFFYKFIISDNLGRFIGPSGLSIAKEFSKRQPFWFYIPQFISGFFPWSLFFISLLPVLLKRDKKTVSDFILVSYIVMTFLLFTLAGVKRGDYILPIYPAASFLIAKAFCSKKPLKSFTLTYFISSVLIIVLLFSLSVILFYSLNPNIQNPFLMKFFSSSDLQKAKLILQHANKIFPFTITLFFISIILSVFAMIKKNLSSYLSTSLCLMTFLFLYSCLMILPIIDSNRNIRSFCRDIKSVVSNKDLWFYGFWNDEFVFYLNRFIEPRTPDKGMGRDTFEHIMKNNDKESFFLIRKNDFIIFLLI